MRPTIPVTCLLVLLAGCERPEAREAGAPVSRTGADTLTTTPAAGDVAATAADSRTRPGPLPPGAQVTVVEGDPGQPGPFRLRMELPGSYEVRPHYHSTSETIQVLEGSILFGLGKRWDDDKLRPLAAGDEVSLEAKAPHYVRTKEPSVIEVRSTGPFDMTYVDPADDPRNSP